MYSRGLFGSFSNRESLLHELNPSIKIICFLICFLLMLFSKDLVLFGVIGVFLLLMMLLTKVSINNYFNIFYSLRYVYLLIIIIGAFIGSSFNDVLLLIVKIIIFFEYAALISFTTSSSELSYGIERVLEPFNLLNLKLGKVSFFVTTLVKIYPTYIENRAKVLKASASRGIDYNHSGLYGRTYALIHSIKPSINMTIDEIRKLKLESKLKLFNIQRKRTNINHNKIFIYDIILLAFHLLFLIAYILERGLLG